MKTINPSVGKAEIPAHIFLNEIKSLQEEMEEDLRFYDGGLTVTTNGVLSKGCRCCKDGKWLCLFPGDQCNAACHFCPNPHTPDYKDHMIAPHQFGAYHNPKYVDEIMVLLDLYAHDAVEGVSYSGGEPFLYLPQIFQIASHVQKYHPYIYQWIYTNGIVGDEDDYKKLCDLDVKEIRFDLAATNFSPKILAKIGSASRTFQYVTAELPAIPNVKQKLIDERLLYRMVDDGVTQINLEELVFYTNVCERHYNGAEFYYYKKFGNKAKSPIFSRKITYEIMKHVIDHKIPVTINDCSNDSQALQGLRRNASPIISMLSRFSG